MIKVSDYIMNYIAGLGVDKVFYVSGGGAMHMNDSLGSNPGLEGVCMLHEQGASIAAEAYARIHEGYGVCLVTKRTGCDQCPDRTCGGIYGFNSGDIYIGTGQARRFKGHPACKTVRNTGG